MIDLDLRRRFFAEEIEALCKLTSPILVDAFAAVPRESYLRPGPWTVLAATEYMPGSGMQTRVTIDADPARVYHNIAVAIDPSRQLFNGQPGTLAVFIDALDLAPGARVLHVGCGLGYYTAVMAHCVGSAGRVVAVEVDGTLAAEAASNLASLPWVEVRHGNASGPLDETFDAILVNAGVTHPLEVWLDALAPGGRIVLPITATMAAMGPTIGKGLVILLTADPVGGCAARVISIVAIYSAEGVRDEALNQRIGKALMSGPTQWAAVKRLRRDTHEPSPQCWLHAAAWCLSAESAV
jgi:protein-L-isoaspartate(D-aspartate) O-methyltransferase